MKLKVLRYNSLRSTNEKAIELIKSKKIKPKIIFSKNQTKGKGTMGKKWISKKGNFFVSILFEFITKDTKVEDISFLNPHIIKNILNMYSKYKINIKRPNDLLIKGKKISGVLQEVIEFELKKYLIIGIGINTLHAPKSSEFKSISLTECSNKKIDNSSILNDIKYSYEILISDIKKNKFSSLKKKICKK